MWFEWNGVNDWAIRMCLIMLIILVELLPIIIYWLITVIQFKVNGQEIFPQFLRHLICSEQFTSFRLIQHKAFVFGLWLRCEKRNFCSIRFKCRHNVSLGRFFFFRRCSVIFWLTTPFRSSLFVFFSQIFVNLFMYKTLWMLVNVSSIYFSVSRGIQFHLNV